MAIAKLIFVTAMVLAAGLAMAGVGLLAHQVLVAEQSSVTSFYEQSSCRATLPHEDA